MKELTITASINNMDAVISFVDEELEALSCPLKAQMQIDVAVDELFSNIARYAYAPGEGDAVIQIEGLENPAGVTIVFIDGGVPYNPLEKADPDVTLSAEERQIGGLGIFMVKKSMDTVTYRYENGKNILQITKHF